MIIEVELLNLGPAENGKKAKLSTESSFHLSGLNWCGSCHNLSERCNTQGLINTSVFFWNCVFPYFMIFN